MKLDAHCAVGQGFDRIMMEDMQDNWTMVPRMYNLHAFDWLCQECGHRKYQGRTPDACPKCGGHMERDILWKEKHNPDTTAMRFGSDLHFQYWREYKKRQKGNLVDTMSLLGACWMLTREKYWELNICDERHGSWGQQGTEVACKTWLSGGRLVCNKRTWFAHMFRTQGGDFGFPYPQSQAAVRRARKYSHELWIPNGINEMPAWDKAIHPMSWLIEKFAPVPGWEAVPSTSAKPARANTTEPAPGCKTPADTDCSIANNQNLRKGIVYYTDNELDPAIAEACRTQLLTAGLPIVSVSLKPIDFGTNIVLDKKRGPLTMFEQILTGLENIDVDIVYFCEHDVLYHPSHFEFMPECDDLFYYNQNSWRVNAKTGEALFHYSSSTSGLCACRPLLLRHYRKRVKMVRENGFTRRMGYEPGTHNRAERVDDYKSKVWMSTWPNIDIRHDKNLTASRWSKSQFRNQRYTRGWTEADEVPGWGVTRDRFHEILEEVKSGQQV